MRVQIIAGLLVVAAAFPVKAQQLPPSALGTGAKDCQAWLEGDTVMNQKASEWVMGYWTAKGVNVSDMTAGATDYDKLVGKARLYCAAHPSEKIFAAAADAYGRLGQ